MANEKSWISLDNPEVMEKGETPKGKWIKVTIYPDEERKEIFFPFSQMNIHEDGQVDVSEWILDKKEEEMPDGCGILTK